MEIYCIVRMHTIEKPLPQERGEGKERAQEGVERERERGSPNAEAEVRERFNTQSGVKIIADSRTEKVRREFIQTQLKRREERLKEEAHHFYFITALLKLDWARRLYRYASNPTYSRHRCVYDMYLVSIVAGQSITRSNSIQPCVGTQTSTISCLDDIQQSDHLHSIQPRSAPVFFYTTA